MSPVSVHPGVVGDVVLVRGAGDISALVECAFGALMAGRIRAHEGIVVCLRVCFFCRVVFVRKDGGVVSVYDMWLWQGYGAENWMHGW